MAKGTASLPRSLPHALIATVLAGMATYGFLAIASRSAGDLGFDQFSVFWAVSLLVGFGLFAPVEQEIARISAVGTGPGSAVRASLPVTFGLAAGGGLLAAGVAVLVIPAASPLLVVCFALLGPVSAVQFLARGLLLGRGRVTAYANVLVLDSVLRIVAASIAAVFAPLRAEGFAIALLVAVLSSHAWVLLRSGRDVGQDQAPQRRLVAVAVLGLLGAGVASQLLLNGGPVLIQALGSTVGSIGAFQAAFNIARIPLFVITPLQSLLVTPFVRLFNDGASDAARRLLARLALAVVAAAIVSGAGAFALGPWAIELVFGPGRSIPASLVGVLVVGTCLNGGLVILTQALIALRRRQFASLTWAAALVLAGVVLAGTMFATGDVVAATCLGFAVGSAFGFAVAAIELAVLRRRTPS